MSAEPDLTRNREHLAADVARILVAEGIDPAMAGSLASEAASRVRFDHFGCAIGLGSLIAELKERDADILVTFMKPATEADNRSALDRDMAAARAAAQAEREARFGELKSGGNPWAKRFWNLTRQSMLANLAPDLAAKLEAEAAR